MVRQLAGRFVLSLVHLERVGSWPLRLIGDEPIEIHAGMRRELFLRSDAVDRDLLERL